MQATDAESCTDEPPEAATADSSALEATARLPALNDSSVSIGNEATATSTEAHGTCLDAAVLQPTVTVGANEAAELSTEEAFKPDLVQEPAPISTDNSILEQSLPEQADSELSQQTQLQSPDTLQQASSELSVAHSSEQLSSDSFSDSATDSASISDAESVPPLTQADVQLLLAYARQTSNCAFGVQAEHDTMRYLNSVAQQAQHAQQGGYSWHNMGAPDNLPLGEHAGIRFELGCQIDRGLCHSRKSSAIPVEFKNRRNYFPPGLPMHEIVQVQAQLQLSKAPMGILVERLQLPGGAVWCQWHEIWRNDMWWGSVILPYLHAFLAVFARLATEQTELDTYVSMRKNGQHHHYLRDLVQQQFYAAFGVSF